MGSVPDARSIVCKFFIDAIEESKCAQSSLDVADLSRYGYFWTCPNGAHDIHGPADSAGDDCKYVHALPPGFVLKSQKKKDDDNVQSISLEEVRCRFAGMLDLAVPRDREA